jgi:hypothetical protein
VPRTRCQANSTDITQSSSVHPRPPLRDRL